MQLLPLFGCQYGGYLNLNGHVLIPVYLRILHGHDSFAAETYLFAGLGIVSMKDPKVHGDQYVTIQIQVPTILTADVYKRQS